MAKRKKSLVFIAFICVCITILLFCGYRIYSILQSDPSAKQPYTGSLTTDTNTYDNNGSGGTVTIPGNAKDPPDTQEPITEPAPAPTPETEPEPEPEPLPWYLTLVNRTNPLPENYENELTHLSNGQDVDSRIYPDLQKMFDDMRSQGVYPVVASGFRTREKQQEIMDSRIKEYVDSGMTEAEAKDEAEKWVALPGTSEHQLGICVDINADGIHSAGYEVYDWLKDHAHEYGFVQRYPEDKTEITGISNEPWHYRYVGLEDAAKMREMNLCLEEYIEYLGK